MAPGHAGGAYSALPDPLAVVEKASFPSPRTGPVISTPVILAVPSYETGGSVAEWLACWTQAQKGPGSNRSRDSVLGKLFTLIVPLFTKQQN